MNSLTFLLYPLGLVVLALSLRTAPHWTLPRDGVSCILAALAAAAGLVAGNALAMPAPAILLQIIVTTGLGLATLTALNRRRRRRGQG